MIQLHKIPKLTSIFAAIATFSQKKFSKTAILIKTNGMLVTNEQDIWSYCQLWKVPKLRSFFAATAAFSKKYLKKLF